jgi:hypothetical protein
LHGITTFDMQPRLIGFGPGCRNWIRCKPQFGSRPNPLISFLLHAAIPFMGSECLRRTERYRSWKRTTIGTFLMGDPR